MSSFSLLMSNDVADCCVEAKTSISMTLCKLPTRCTIMCNHVHMWDIKDDICYWCIIIDTSFILVICSSRDSLGAVRFEEALNMVFWGASHLVNGLYPQLD